MREPSSFGVPCWILDLQSCRRGHRPRRFPRRRRRQTAGFGAGSGWRRVEGGSVPNPAFWPTRPRSRVGAVARRRGLGAGSGWRIVEGGSVPIPHCGQRAHGASARGSASSAALFRLVTPKSDLRFGKSDLRSSESDVRFGKNDLRSGESDVRFGKNDLRSGESDVRFGKNDLRSGKSDVRFGKNDLRSGKSDVRFGKDDLRSGKCDLRFGKSDLRFRKSDLRFENRKTLLRLEAPRKGWRTARGGRGC